jgi:hypothetical protein
MISISIWRQRKGWGIRSQIPFFNGVDLADWNAIDDICFHYLDVTGMLIHNTTGHLKWPLMLCWCIRNR